MSYSIDECISDCEKAMEAARAVKERFPDATMEVLWKGGPKVFASLSAKPTEVMLSVDGDYARLYPYELVDGAAVFLSRLGRGASLHVLLDRIRRAKPDLYAAIVAAAVEEMR